MKKKITPSNTKNKHKHKRNEENESRIAIKSIIKHHCNYCGAAFAQMNNFTRHLQTHNEHDKYFDTCITKYYIVTIMKTFISSEQDSIIEKAHLEYNIDESTIDVYTTIKQKNHGCLYCHRTFPSLSLLATHTRVGIIVNQQKRIII